MFVSPAATGILSGQSGTTTTDLDCRVAEFAGESAGWLTFAVNSNFALS
jgi:hypothetical protein